MMFPTSLTTDDETDFGEGDFFCVEGIVARNDDPENRCRVQLVFHQFDENEIYPLWARRLNFYVGLNGFGDYFIPEVGAEVVVIGRFGDSNSLFYSPLWNESTRPSSDFPDKTVAGIRVQNNLKLIAEKQAEIQAKNIEFTAQELIKNIAQSFDVLAEQAARIKAENATIEASSAMQINGATVKINGDGSISISGGIVSISGGVVRLQNRIVNKIGGAI